MKATALIRRMGKTLRRRSPVRQRKGLTTGIGPTIGGIIIPAIGTANEIGAGG